MERRVAMMEQADQRLMIEACRKGDRDAFRQLYEQYKDRVYSIAVNFTGDEAAARDISQQVFLKLFTTIGGFRQEANFSTWLYRLVVNACLDELRRRKRFLSFDILAAGGDQPVERIEQGLSVMSKTGGRSEKGEDYAGIQEAEMIKAAVLKLRPKLRIAILLKYFEGMSYEEMARALGCSTGTVASRLNRGHRELARLLAHLQP